MCVCVCVCVVWEWFCGVGVWCAIFVYLCLYGEVLVSGDGVSAVCVGSVCMWDRENVYLV